LAFLSIKNETAEKRLVPLKATLILSIEIIVCKSNILYRTHINNPILPKKILFLIYFNSILTMYLLLAPTNTIFTKNIDMTRYIFLASISLFIFLTACNNTGNKDRLILTNIAGEPNEVLVVMDKLSWEAETGKTLKDCLQEAYYGLPQYEPLFKAIQIERSGFSNMFQLYRNIIDVHISADVKSSKIWFGNDVYARPQAYLKIEAKNGIEFSKLIKNNNSKIQAFFKKAEIERLQKMYKHRFSEKIMKHLRDKFDIMVDVPANYKLETDTNTFSWISFETPQMSQGIFVYTYNYNDTSQFNLQNLIKTRDSFLKEYVPGSRKGSYMQTEHEYPVRRTVAIDSAGFYSVFLEGLWRVEGDFMGGPFISYSFPDKENNKIICVEGYIYNPKKDKRNFIMQLESIIKTARYN